MVKMANCIMCTFHGLINKDQVDVLDGRSLTIYDSDLHHSSSVLDTAMWPAGRWRGDKAVALLGSPAC